MKSSRGQLSGTKLLQSIKALAVFLSATLAMAEEPSRQESLLPAWQKFDSVPILNYGWPKNASPEMRTECYRDYRAMGITGIYKVDKEPSIGGELFLKDKLHGFMYATPFSNAGDKVLGADGNPASFLHNRDHIWRRSMFSPKNRLKYWTSAAETAEKYGSDKLFQAEGTIVMSSWDETGLYSREAMEYGYDAKERFDKYLKEIGAAPQTNLPVFADRYKNPGPWRLWIDFHAYYTNLFFREAGRSIGEKLGHDVELFPFAHATMKWPGASSARGLDAYRQARTHRILTVEDCQADYPGSTIAYSLTDQLSRRYGRPVIGWSWFWPQSDRSNDPDEAGRSLARAMGHNVHGLLFWVYTEKWGEKPAMRASVAYWHKLFNAHWPFLRQAWITSPKVAVLYPRNTGNMYYNWDYPKTDYGWTIQALTETHVPFEVVTDNQIEAEPEVLNDYKVLIIPSAAWEGEKFLAAVKEFVKKGGFVMADGDSLSLSVETGKPTTFLKDVFSVQPGKKSKGIFFPTYDDTSEHAWVKDKTQSWQMAKWQPKTTGEESDLQGRCEPLVMDDSQFADLAAALPKLSGTGLPQSLLDPRIKHIIKGEADWNPPAEHRTFHDIVTGIPLPNGKIVARFGGEACAIETAQTLWLGFRPGFDHACVFPLREMAKWGEQVWPFDKTLSADAKSCSSSRNWISRILDKAGIKPEFDITYDGQPCPWLEVLKRGDRNGDALLFLIDHEGHAGKYKLKGLQTAAVDLMSGKTLQSANDGSVEIDIPAKQVVMLAIGTKQFREERLKAHQAVSRDIPPMPKLK